MGFGVMVPSAVADGAFLFLSLVVQGVPFLLLGAALSAMVNQWVPVERWLGWVPRHPGLAAVCGALAGFLIPTCECAAVPLVRRLVMRGLPASAALGYLFGSPGVNPVALVSTWIAYQGYGSWLVTGLRAGGGFFLAVGLAWLLTAKGSRFAVRGELLLPGARQGEMDGPIPAQPAVPGSGMARWVLAMWNDFWVVLVYYTLGCLLAAGLQVGWMADWELGEAWRIPGMMGLAIGMSLCSSADAFVATSFVGVPLAAQLAFLWTGPILDLKLAWMYRVVLTRRAILTLAVAVVAGVWVVSWILSGYLW